MIPLSYDAPDTIEGSVPMRGDDQQSGWMFSYVSPEERVPADHPLRAIRQMTEAIFARLSPRFDRLYSTIGRPSIPPTWAWMDVPPDAGQTRQTLAGC